MYTKIVNWLIIMLKVCGSVRWIFSSAIGIVGLSW